MAWTAAARAASLAVRRARKQLNPKYANKQIRMATVKSTIQGIRNKMWAKTLKNSRSDAQHHLVKPKWAMSAKMRRLFKK